MFGLTRKALTSLGVVAVSLVLLLCLMSYGTAEYADPGVAPNWKVGLARSFVDVCGAGAYVLALLPLVWAVIVYFQERTPDLVLRGVGTVALACSTSMIAGLATSGEPGVWTGDLGAATSGLVSGLSSTVGAPLAAGVGWMLSCALFLVSLIVATDWLFHTVRRGESEDDGSGVGLLTEPTPAELRIGDEEPEARGFVESDSAAARAAAEIEVQDDGALARRFEELTEGWSTQDLGDRTVLRSPTGYQGVDFEDTGFELAEIRRDDAISYSDHEAAFTVVLHDTEETSHTDLDSSPPLGAVTGEIDSALSWLDDFDEQVVAEASVDSAEDALAERTEANARLIDDEVVPQTLDDGLLSVGAALPTVVLDDAYGVEQVHADEDDEPEEFETREADAVIEFEEPSAGALDLVDVAAPQPATPWATETSIDPAMADDTTLDVVVVESIAESAGTDAGELDDDGPDDATVEAVPSLEAVLGDAMADDLSDADAEDDPVAGGDNALLEVATAIQRETEADAVPHDQVELPLFVAAATVTGRDGEIQEQAIDDDATEDVGATPLDADALGRIEPDPLFGPAVDAVLARGRASIVVLQRRLGIGHGRALRLLEQMTVVGVLGEEAASGARPILVRRDDWDDFAARYLPADD